jgi:hypothetical protein
MTLSIDIQHNSIECHYAECRDYLHVMQNVIMLSVVRMNVVMLSVIAPSNGVDVSTKISTIIMSIFGYHPI